MSPDLELIRATKGFLDEEEGWHLHRLALDAAGRGPCLEIGSYCGKSALWIGSACRQRAQVLFSLDHHRGSEEQQPGEEYFDPALFDPAAGGVDTFRHFRATLARGGLETAVVPIVCRSDIAAAAWATPLSFIFIDGGHAFDTVMGDFRGWSPHLIPGGLLAFHDVFPDPSHGGHAPYQVYRHALESGRFAEHSVVKSLAALVRTR
ncbi:MAG: class I SAM-dependent methyltransferase [Desulfobacterales bacterium]|jgi:predicted O-methyltransferase YrrM|nr:class I SAM-dependent methyltransferase [Desulfobacterales bacterium]